MTDHDAEVVAVLADALRQAAHNGAECNDEFATDQLAALTAANYAVVKLPEGMAVEHGARLVPAWLSDRDIVPPYVIAPPEKATP